MKLNRYAKSAWFVVIYTLLVVLWGAFVRATGSGAGCGSHWPLCNGEVVPRAPAVETLIEYSHRLTSGMLGVFAIGLLIWAWRAFPKGHPVRLGALLSLFLVIVEGLIGAALVRLEYVADNASLARAIWMGGHLANTLFLLGAQSLTAWWASGGKPIRLRGQGLIAPLLIGGLVAMTLVSATGAVTALGDTLFPATSLAEGLQEKFSSTAHFLVRLRLIHPAMAIATGLYLLVVANLVRTLRPDPTTERLARTVSAIFFLQIGAGFLNVALLVPIWLQLVHLLLADLIWIALVLLSASALALERPQATVRELVTPLPQGQ